MPGQYYEELTVGRVFRHAVRRTVSETDNVLYSTLTMNPAALHLDEDYCRRNTEFGRRIVNSAFTIGLVVGLSVADTTMGTTVGNMGFDEIRFPAPIFHGDTVRVETEVMDRRESKSRPNAGLVTFEHRAYNQDEVLVARMRRVALMLRQPASSQAAS